MARRLSILFATLIAVGCGGSQTSTDDSHQGPKHFVNAPQISHTITVSTKTDLGTQSAPTIQTCVSMGAGDTIMWIGSDGNLKFDWVTPSGPKPYDPSSCNGTTASCTATFQSGSWTVNQYFDYTLNVGGSHPICGRIIIKP